MNATAIVNPAGGKPPAKLVDPVDAHVGARIRLLRRSLGVSQEVLARHLGLTFQQVQKYERALNRVSASMLFHIAVVLKVSPAYFFEGLDQAGLPADNSTQLLSEMPELLDVAALTPRDQRVVKAVVGALSRGVS